MLKVKPIINYILRVNSFRFERSNYKIESIKSSRTELSVING